MAPVDSVMLGHYHSIKYYIEWLTKYYTKVSFYFVKRGCVCSMYVVANETLKRI